MSRSNPSQRPAEVELPLERKPEGDAPGTLTTNSPEEWDAAMKRSEAGEFRVWMVVRKKPGQWLLYVCRPLSLLGGDRKP